MQTGIHSLTEAEREDLAGSNVLDFVRRKGDPLSLGEILAGFVLPDLAVRMRGNFELPRLMVRSDEGGIHRP